MVPQHRGRTPASLETHMLHMLVHCGAYGDVIHAAVVTIVYWLVVLTILKNIKSMGRIIPYIMEKMFDTTNQIIYVSTPCHLIEDTDMVLACLRHCWFGTTDIHNEAATISVSSATRSMGLWPEAWQPMAWQSSWSIDGFRLTDKHHKHLVIILRRPTGYWKKMINKKSA